MPEAYILDALRTPIGRFGGALASVRPDDLAARAAFAAALMPEAQRRFTVSPGTLTGSPASSAAMRATLRLSSPAWLAHPAYASSIAAGSTPARARTTATWRAWASSSPGSRWRCPG